MDKDRRIFVTGLAGVAATLTLSACMDNPGTLTVSAQGMAGANPGADGQDRPLTIFLLQMTGSGAFDSADFYALQNPSAALGGELVKSDQIVLAPGGTPKKIITMQAGTTVVGIMAAFRNPAGKRFRAKTPAPGNNAGILLSVGPSGLQVSDV